MRGSASGCAQPSGSIGGTWRGKSGVWTRDDEELAVCCCAVDVTGCCEEIEGGYPGSSYLEVDY